MVTSKVVPMKSGGRSQFGMCIHFVMIIFAPTKQRIIANPMRK